MDEAIYGCGSGHLVLKDLLPLREGQVAGDHDAATLVTVCQQVEEHLHLVATVLHVTDVIDDEQIEADTEAGYVSEAGAITDYHKH